MTPARLHTSTHVVVRESGNYHADWRNSAACLDEDPELFFPIGYTGPAIAQTANAKAVCARCRVRADCRQWALDTRQGYGIWGGLDDRERVNLLRREYRARVKRDACPDGAA